ncbi:MAG: lactonase family protein [Microbacteriaceae bacterium]|nr:MAG: lactonase family protein [Microbacteriaceae bacterium]
MWSGSYTADSNGHGTGIGLVHTADDGTLGPVRSAVVTDSPSFIARHPSLPVVYAVSEVAQTIQAFAVAEAVVRSDVVLVPLGEPWLAGAAVCHVTIDPTGQYAIAACWGDGKVLAYELDGSGRITARHETDPAVDPYADPIQPGGEPTWPNGEATRPGGERHSRAHASVVLPDGRVLTTNLGYDLVRVWRYVPGRGLVADHDVTLPRGSGPRHPALHPSGHVYIVTEYSVEAVVLQPDAAGRYSVVQVTPVISGGPASTPAGVPITGAHISIDESGEHVHVTVRAANRVAVLAVRDGGARLGPLAEVDCGGNWPRHHLQRGSLLHVANQLSDTITTFRLDAAGVPSVLLQTRPTGSPTCLIERR